MHREVAVETPNGTNLGLAGRKRHARDQENAGVIDPMIVTLSRSWFAMSKSRSLGCSPIDARDSSRCPMPLPRSRVSAVKAESRLRHHVEDSLAKAPG